VSTNICDCLDFWGWGLYAVYACHAHFSQKNRPIGYQVHKKIATPTKFYQIWCSMLKLQLPIYKSCTKTKSCGILFQQFFWHNVRKRCFSDWEFLISLEQFLVTECFFVPGGFSYLICILLPKLFSPTLRKNCSSDWEKLFKYEAESWELWFYSSSFKF